jgi:hypothetical protein
LSKNSQFPGYDEAVVSPDGKKIVFTSTRSGDLELWTMDIDGKIETTNLGLGYDGGHFSLTILKKLYSVLLDQKPMPKLKNTKIISLKISLLLPIWKSTPSMLMEQI